LAKSGSGTQTLSGTNSYNGTTTVTAGVLNILNAAALGTTANGTSVTSGAALQIQGNIIVGAEALALNGSGITSDGALRNISGNNTYGGNITLGSATRINSDSGTLTLNGTATITGASFGLTVGGAGNTTISSAIGTTSGILTKDGAGTLTLTGNNTFTGATTVSAGTLKAAASNALGATSGIMVNTGGTLLISANGAIGTNTTITMNSTATGNGTAAALVFSSSYNGTVGDLTLNYDSIFDLGADATGVQVHFSNIFLNGHSLSIYNWTGTTLWNGGDGNNTDQIYADNALLQSDLNRISFYSGLDTSSFVGTGYQITSGSFISELGPVPEPSTWVAMAALALTGGTIAMRRRDNLKNRVGTTDFTDKHG
jgi:autotransporter-associated beta strand protein